MISFQSWCSTETLWTFTANIRLHTFMLKWVQLQFMMCNEFLLTNVTREPSTFIVWLQQMSLQLVKPSKVIWAVTTWVRLCISVNTNMLLQFNASLKVYSTVSTMIRSSVTVYTTFMCLQAGRAAEIAVTHWTLKWFISRVNSHVLF